MEKHCICYAKLQVRILLSFPNGDHSLTGKMYSLHGMDAGSNPADLPK